jgi:hypothetical protein
MNTWIDRLRFSLILSPALMLMQIWFLVFSSGELIAKYGLTIPLFLLAASSVVEAYTFVMAVEFWKKKQ